MLYSSKDQAIDKKIGQMMSVAGIRMLKWMNWVTAKDKIRNEQVIGSIEVASIVDMMTKNILR